MILECDEQGNTLLHRTAMYDDIPLMRGLIEYLSTPDRQLVMSLVNNSGQTPLDLAQTYEMRYLMVTGSLLYESHSMWLFSRPTSLRLLVISLLCIQLHHGKPEFNEYD